MSHRAASGAAQASPSPPRRPWEREGPANRRLPPGLALWPRPRRGPPASRFPGPPRRWPDGHPPRPGTRPEGARGRCLGNEVQKTEHGAPREQSSEPGSLSSSPGVPLFAISTCWFGAGVTLSVTEMGWELFFSRSVVFFLRPHGVGMGW